MIFGYDPKHTCNKSKNKTNRIASNKALHDKGKGKETTYIMREHIRAIHPVRG